MKRDSRVAARTSALMRRFKFADRGDIENRLMYSLNYARESFRPDFGMSLSAYEGLCLQNGASHVMRSLCAEAKRRNATTSLDEVVGEDLTLGDLLCDSRDGVRRMVQAISLREYLATLSGTTWSVVVAILAGYRRAEIARHLHVPRTTFDRVYGPAIQRLREVVA